MSIHVTMYCRKITSPHLCLWSQHHLELADNLNKCHFCLQQSKSHSNAASWTIAKRHVGTRMTLGLFLISEPVQEGRIYT